MVSSDKTGDHNVSSDKLSPRRNITVPQEIHDTTVQESIPQGAGIIPSIVTINDAKDSGANMAFALQSNQEVSTYSSPQDKHLQSPGTLSRPSQSAQDSPSLIREEVSKDGYNWRKYGQKNVKGNEFIRSYYKCTHPNCFAKKQLEQSNNGHITDSICIFQHNHPKPQLNTTQPIDRIMPAVEQILAKPALAFGEEVSPTDEVKAANLQSTWAKDDVRNNEDRESKRLKKSNNNADLTGVERSTSQSRVVVQTSSEVDLVNDGYRWRKYGQKQVKGNANPRSYYRCSNPGCPVKKHVERDCHDPKIVITTYEGRHDHEIPPGRSATHNAATNTETMIINDKPGNKSGGDIVCLDAGEPSSLDSESRLSDQLIGESISKSEAGSMVEFRVTNLPSEDPESKLSEQEQQNDNSGTQEDSENGDIICHSSSEIPCGSNEQLKDEVETKSERSKDCMNVAAVHDTLGEESDFDKQSACDAEPVQS
ncbi:hypothetical protein RIF29_23934 [Crotalaria pallida]|uniref:WRKY domain-containing protein n=1 Tax=Crotalaria pallida TaxID=3830 RepID=A0AAN9ELA2_CROPI